jgi:hypothetical protein
MSERTKTAGAGREHRAEIHRLEVVGFKSISAPCGVQIQPLTVLAGANSSGKSSMLQPLLMLKQTLDASFDPGPLLLDGPNVRFTEADQFFSRQLREGATREFSVSIGVPKSTFKLSFIRARPKGVGLHSMEFDAAGRKMLLSRDSTQDELRAALPSSYLEIFEDLKHASEDLVWRVERVRCFFEVKVERPTKGRHVLFPFGFSPADPLGKLLREAIHVPGLRGNPERAYKTTAVGPLFGGTFPDYVASVVNHWKNSRDGNLDALGEQLHLLGLSWKVTADQINDTQLEIRVGRLQQGVRGGAKDLVNIADVGFGVSQILPVLVALLAAGPGRLVFIEQPEIHLHPRAQAAMGDILAAAARRGVRVVVETHSALLLLRLQTLVAEGYLAPELLSFNWFTRRPRDGATEVTPASLDRRGRFGDWPEDFGEVSLHEEARYLDAAEAPSESPL